MTNGRWDEPESSAARSAIGTMTLAVPALVTSSVKIIVAR